MADLRTELDEVAVSLEKCGRADLATIIDICNNEIHTRVASLKAPKPAVRPARSASTVRVSSAEALKKIRWARTELKDLAREFKKAGSMAEYRKLLKASEDLAEDEAELAGKETEGDPVAGEQVKDFSGEVELDTMEACVMEMQAIAKELNKSRDIKDRKAASVLIRESRKVLADCLDIEVPVVTDGVEPLDSTNYDFGTEDFPEFKEEDEISDDIAIVDVGPVDIDVVDTDGDVDFEEFSDDDDLDLDDADMDVDLDGGDEEDIISDDVLDGAGDAVEDEVIEEEVNPDEYLEASASLARVAKTLASKGFKVQANKLIRKANSFRAEARTAKAKLAKAKAPLRAPVKASIDQRKAAFDRALAKRKASAKK